MDKILNQLTIAEQHKDISLLERALDFSNEKSFGRQHTKILCKILLDDWHGFHEDILMTLDTIKDPESISSIVKRLTLKLEYFTGYEIPRKAIWALRSINTDESIAQ
jgi:hypothetical protein